MPKYCDIYISLVDFQVFIGHFSSEKLILIIAEVRNMNVI